MELLPSFGRQDGVMAGQLITTDVLGCRGFSDVVLFAIHISEKTDPICILNQILSHEKTHHGKIGNLDIWSFVYCFAGKICHYCIYF